MSFSNQVAIFWDFENCRPPSNVAGHVVIDRIRRALQITGSITLVKAYIELTGENMNAKTALLYSELQSSGVSLTHCPHNGKKDVADKMMLVDIMAFAIDKPAPATIVLITGDRDFAYAVSILKLRGYEVVLIVPPVIAHASLKAQASRILEWQKDVLGGIEFGTKGNLPVEINADAQSSDIALDAKGWFRKLAPFEPSPEMPISVVEEHTRPSRVVPSQPIIEQVSKNNCSFSPDHTDSPFEPSYLSRTALSVNFTDAFAGGQMGTIRDSIQDSKYSGSGSYPTSGFAIDKRSLPLISFRGNVNSQSLSTVEEAMKPPRGDQRVDTYQFLPSGILDKSCNHEETTTGELSATSLAGVDSPGSSAFNKGDQVQAVCNDENNADIPLSTCATTPGDFAYMECFSTRTAVKPVILSTEDEPRKIIKIGNVINNNSHEDSIPQPCYTPFRDPSHPPTPVPNHAVISGVSSSEALVSVPRFSLLIQFFIQKRAMGITRVRSSEIAVELLKRDQHVYERAGVTRFKQYIDAARQANIIISAGLDANGDAWVELNPEIAPGFEPLIILLRENRPTHRLLFSRVGELISKHYPDAYLNADVAGLSAYLAKGEGLGICITGGAGSLGRQWVELTEQWTSTANWFSF